MKNNFKVLYKQTAVIILALIMAAGGFTMLGGFKTRTAEAANTAKYIYTVENVTLDTAIKADYMNFDMCIVDSLYYYDSTYGANSSADFWSTKEIIAEPDTEPGEYIIAEVVDKTGMQAGSAIPEGGFVLAAQGDAISRLDGYAAGQKIKYHDNRRYVFRNTTRGNDLYIAGVNSLVAENFNVYLPTFGATTPAENWRNVVTVAHDGESFKVTGVYPQDGGGATMEKPIPANGFVLVGHGAFSTQAVYKFTVGDVIELFDREAEYIEDAKFTAVKGDAEFVIMGKNPQASATITGKSLIYTNTYSSIYTRARTDTFTEYAVSVDEGVHTIIEKTSAGGTYIPYNGYVLSIPSTVTGYNSLNAGNVLTVTDGNNPAITYPAFAVENITTEKRFFVDGVDLGNFDANGQNTARGADMLLIFTPAFEDEDPSDGNSTGTNPYGAEVTINFVGGKYVVEKVQPGVGDSVIPANGYVLSGHGTAAALISTLTVGDEIEIRDWAAENDTSLATLTVNGTTIEDFSATKTEYSITLPAGTSTAPVIAATTADGEAGIVLTQVTGVTGIASIVVTSATGRRTTTYSIQFTLSGSSVATLASIKIGGTDLEGFAANTTSYSVKLAHDAKAYPEITVTTNSNATYSIDRPATFPGTVTITVTSENTVVSKTYTIVFTLEDAPAKTPTGCGSLGINGESGTGIIIIAILTACCFMLRRGKKSYQV